MQKIKTLVKYSLCVFVIGQAGNLVEVKSWTIGAWRHINQREGVEARARWTERSRYEVQVRARPRSDRREPYLVGEPRRRALPLGHPHDGFLPRSSRLPRRMAPA